MSGFLSCTTHPNEAFTSECPACLRLQIQSLTDILWKGLACLDLHGGKDSELNAKWVAQARALGDRLEGTEKRKPDKPPPTPMPGPGRPSTHPYS